MSRPLSFLTRTALTVGSATIALADPRRADMVAMVGDLTSGSTLPRLRQRIEATSSGREMLSSLQPSRFPEGGSEALPSLRELPDGSLGREYARFMDDRGFDPESRLLVRYVDDPRDAWILQRYRDVHDLWHVLTDMPTTVLGELAQKWFEAAQTGLPVAVLSAVAGPLRLSTDDRRILVKHLIPWAVDCGRCAPDLLAIRYEDVLHRDLEQLRGQWGIYPAPIRMKKRKV